MDRAIAILYNKGICYGSVSFDSTQRNRTRVSFTLAQFEPFQVHAIHIHEYGDLTNGCASLGGHYNPSHQVHGQHDGDLIYNFKTNKQGKFKYTYIAKLNIADLYGRSVVIHQYPDDLGQPEYDDLSVDELTHLCTQLGYKVRGKHRMINELTRQSYISGNAGRRMACGVIGRAERIFPEQEVPH